VVRVALAWIFIYYGAGKLFDVFQGPGIHASAQFFTTTAHLRPGTFFAYLSGTTEFVGGIAVGLGIFARLFALALFGDMVIAMVTVTFRHGLIPSVSGSGYGLNLALAALAGVIVLAGPGRYAFRR
jgi:putative oxidoreductase